MLENIEVGAMGWQCRDFYPEDLPVEWQLDYYANHFSALLVPQYQWQGWQEDDCEAFLESSDTLRWCGFGIKTALEDKQAEKLYRLLNALHDRGQAVGLASHVAVPDALEQWPITWFDRSELAASWRWQHLSGTPLGWLATMPEDLGEARELLASFAASLPENMTGAPFILRNGCDNMQKLMQLKQLLELMGY